MRNWPQLSTTTTPTPQRKLASITLSLMLLISLSACIGQQPIFYNAEQCSRWLPSRWKTDDVPSASRPNEDTVGSLAAFGAAQTGQLDKANDRTHDAIEIVTNCELSQVKAQKEIEKPWYQFW